MTSGQIQTKSSGVGSKSRFLNSTRELLKELEHGLRQLIGLCEHGDSGLNEDITTSQIGGFIGDIDILNLGTGCGEIFGRGHELVRGEVQPRLVSSDRRSILRQLINRGFDRDECGGRVGDRIDRGGGRGGIRGGAQIDSAHRKSGPFGVGGDIKSAGREQRNAVKILARTARDVRTQLSEFSIIERAIPICLGRILRENGQFTHAIQCFLNFREISILRLGKRQRVSNIILRRGDALNL